MEKPNLEYIIKLSGGDENFKATLVAVIKEEFPQERAEFEANITAFDYLAASRNVHKLKHKFSILGLEQGYQLADEFEEDLKNSEHEKLLSFTHILDVISAFLEQI